MKTIIIILLLGISLSFDAGASRAYAARYNTEYNPNYKNYKYQEGDSANFVSQCLYNGGQSFSGCAGLDSKGMIPKVNDLKTCLLSKGWRSSSTKPVNYKSGYPMFYKNSYGTSALIATRIEKTIVFYCSHNPDGCGFMKESTEGLEYYFL